MWSYNSDTEKWSTLPECQRQFFTLTVIADLVTIVGGLHYGSYTNTLLSLMKEGRKRWVEHFPPMPTKRKFTAVLSTGKITVVSGGLGEGDTVLATVEVMDADTLHWSTVSNLPQPLSDASATVCGGKVYIAGGKDKQGHPTKSVFTCSLSALLKSKEMESVWNTVVDPPVKGSTCVTLYKRTAASSRWTRFTREAH